MHYSNPFIINSPVIESSMFVGRQRSLTNLWRWSAKPGTSPVLFLEGPSGIGKTSLLFRFREGAFGSYLVPVIVDSSKLPLESPAEFLWMLAKQIKEGFQNQQLEVPDFEKSIVVLRPWEAFRDQFWKKLPHYLDDKILVLAMDNFDSFFASKALRDEFSMFRKYLMLLLNDYNQARAIFVIKGRAHAYTDKLLSPFNRFQSDRLRTFSYAESVELMNRARNFPVYRDVADLIFTITSGNPGDIQRLCHVLYERIASGKINQLAMSDVISILDVELAPKDFHTNVYGRYGKFYKEYALSLQ